MKTTTNRTISTAVKWGCAVPRHASATVAGDNRRCIARPLRYPDTSCMSHVTIARPRSHDVPSSQWCDVHDRCAARRRRRRRRTNQRRCGGGAGRDVPWGPREGLRRFGRHGRQLLTAQRVIKAALTVILTPVGWMCTNPFLTWGAFGALFTKRRVSRLPEVRFGRSKNCTTQRHVL